MNLADLKIRLEQGETLNTEFKQWPLYSDDLAFDIDSRGFGDRCRTRHSALDSPDPAGSRASSRFIPSRR
jgi:hypothetical protein